MPFRNDEARNAECFSGPDHGAKIVRVLDTIEHNDQRLVILEENVEVRVSDFAGNRDDSLMHFTASQAVENHAFFLADGNTTLPREIEDLSYLSRLRFARDVDSFDRL